MGYLLRIRFLFGILKFFFLFGNIWSITDIHDKEGDVCKPSWFQSGLNCYKFFGEQRRFHAAQTVCSKYGGHVISISDAYENELGANLTGESESWLGLLKQKNTQFEWTDASKLNFSKWWIFRPDGSGNCVIMKSGGYWVDRSCSYALPFICKIVLPGLDDWVEKVHALILIFTPVILLLIMIGVVVVLFIKSYRDVRIFIKGTTTKARPLDDLCKAVLTNPKVQLTPNTRSQTKLVNNSLAKKAVLWDWSVPGYKPTKFDGAKQQTERQDKQSNKKFRFMKHKQPVTTDSSRTSCKSISADDAQTNTYKNAYYIHDELRQVTEHENPHRYPGGMELRPESTFSIIAPTDIISGTISNDNIFVDDLEEFEASYKTEVIDGYVEVSIT